MSAPFDAFQLPVPATGPFRSFRAGDLACRYPEPTADLLGTVARHLGSAGERLARRSVEDIIQVIDGAAARLADPHDPLRREAEALIPAATGYSPAMVRLVLDRMAADWRADALRRVLGVELGGTAAIDGSVPRGDRARTMALGPRLAFHVFSGNVPGVAVTSLIRALLVKGPSFGKLAAGEPVLPVLFTRALAALDPEIADAVAVSYWPGGEEAPERVLLAAADTIIAYGGEEVVASLRTRAGPGHRLVLHGPKISFGAVGTASVEGGAERLAARVARAVATFDQQGCVSPHSIWVEGPEARAAALAADIAAALRLLQDEIPRGAIDAAEAAAIQQERGAAEMRAHVDPRTRVWAGPGTTWTVVLERTEQPRPSCLNRFVRVHPIDDLARLPALLAPFRVHLQAIALEGAGDREERIARDLARAGATRITSFDRLPWPPPEAHHDGAPPLRELLRWTDREQ
ncbi:MAG TPA: acyl-CoA reductase [Longimicrobiales bacterium]|nr:acyl-CoA reductase [Longimicrobiales bacterium]